MSKQPLRYKIRSLHQLTSCLSNNSRDLQISVTDFIQNDKLEGLCIRVTHSEFGVLFACMPKSRGNLLYRSDDADYYTIPIEVMLKELEKFGFFVEYDPALDLNDHQIDLLVSVMKMGFDKVRVLSVYENKPTGRIFYNHVVAFISNIVPDLLLPAKAASSEEYNSYIEKGIMLNLGALSRDKMYDWSFLHNSVQNIEDIIRQAWRTED